jgi:hypothetical protein
VAGSFFLIAGAAGPPDLILIKARPPAFLLLWKNE